LLLAAVFYVVFEYLFKITFAWRVIPFFNSISLLEDFYLSMASAFAESIFGAPFEFIIY